MPGPLGYESGKMAAAVSARGYMTRAMSGVERDGGEWSTRNHLGERLPFSHNLAEIFTPEVFRTNPEFFPLVDDLRMAPSKGLVNWNPDLGRVDVARFAAQTARRYFEDNPHAISYPLGVNDGLVFGESPETLSAVTPLRWFRGRPDYSNLIFRFMNRAAEELALTHPEKYLGALAYYWGEQTPDFPVHDRVLPVLTADRSQSYDLAFKDEELDLQRRWGNLAGRREARDDEGKVSGRNMRRLGLYDYLYGSGFLIPRFHPHLLAENLKHARRVGFTDYFAEVNPNWGLDGPQPWLVATLLADPEQSVERLLDEYFRRYFQEAAEPMRRFFARAEETWMRQKGRAYWLKYYRDESQADVFPSAVCAEMRALLTAAERQARSSKTRARVAFVSEAFGLTERFVAFHKQRSQLWHQVLQSDPQRTASVELLRNYLDARKAFVRYAQGLSRTQPLAFHPINYGDFLRNNPAFSAVSALLGQEADRSNPMQSLLSRSEVWMEEAREFYEARRGGRLRELISNGSLEGPRHPGRRTAQLVFGIDLPEPWRSKVEPAQRHEASVVETAARRGRQGLRITGTTNASLFQWAPANPGQIYAASVFVKGAVASSSVVLSLAWLDERHQPIGLRTAARLPVGQWTDWVELSQGSRAPVGARWVGIALRVQNQREGDWLELDDFSLMETMP